MTERDHLDPATLAALVDRTLDAAARAAADAHLAVCAECREVWVETSALAAEGATAAASRKASTGSTRRWIYAGAAIAASVIIGVGLLLRGSARSDEPGLDGLLRLTGGRRFAEARTSLELPWQPRPSPVRSGEGAAHALAEKTSDALEQTALASNDPAAFHRAGLAALVMGRPTAAIDLLERASALGNTSVDLDLDLSAALLEKCRVSCTDEDKQRALAAADRALSKRPDSGSALFNRALALEGLERREDASRAWQEALLRQVDPGWRGEIGGRLERLRHDRKP